MKPVLNVCWLLLFLLVSRQAVYAQTTSPEHLKKSFTRGQWQVDLRDGYGRGSLFDNHNAIQIHSGYYIVDKLLLGIGAKWSKEWVGDVSFNELTLGPLARYQFTRGRLSPYIEASYQFGRRRSGANSSISYPSLNMQSVSFSPGLSVGLASSLRIDISYGFQYLINGFTNLYGQPQLGINYLFPNK